MARRVLVNLVSEQPIPNLVAALHEGLVPDHVILLHTNMQGKPEERLRDIIVKRLGITAELISVEPYDLQGIVEQCRAIIENHKDDNIVFNATCGTKIMGMGGYLAFKGVAEIIYVETSKGQILTLREDGQSQKRPMANCLSIKEYLQSYDNRLNKKRPYERRWTEGESPLSPITATARLAFRLSKEEKGSLKLLVDSLSRERQLSIARQQSNAWQPLEVDLADMPASTREALAAAAQEDGLDVRLNGELLAIEAKRDYRFLHGGWLEDFTFRQAVLAQPNEAIMGAFLADDGHWSKLSEEAINVTNELDCVLLRENRLFLLECKTWDFGDKDAPGKGDIFYKLDVLKKRTGGLFGKAALVSLFPLDKAMEERADAYGLKIFHSDSLETLSEKLQAWIALPPAKERA